MNGYHMTTPLSPRYILLMMLLCVGLWSSGCASSDETMEERVQVQPPQPSATELMQRDLATLHARNDSLLILVSKLERDNQSANARATEAETQLNEFKSRAVAPPQKPKVVPVSGGTYEQGLQLFRGRRYAEAAGIFQGIVDSGTPADLQDNCHYWLGECAYAVRAYKEAINHFNEVFTFKISEKKDDAQMMIANSYLAMGDKANARAEYQKLIDKYPASTFIPRAKEKLAKL